MKTYIIRIDIMEGQIYTDYVVKANDIWSAKMLAQQKFLKEFPSADILALKFSILEPTKENVEEVLNIMKQNILK